MGTSVKQWLRSLLQRASEKLQRPQKGQSLVIVILAMIGILALVGLSIDLGLVYVERVRVGQAADAAALAAVVELPAENAAHERARVYLMENGYDADAPGVRLVIDGAYVSGPAEEDAKTILWVDTAFSRSTEGVANRVRVRVKRWVPMTFLQFIGFRRLPVEGAAEAENINNLDVVIVYDESGSMEFDTLCYGCWEWDKDILGPNKEIIFPLKWSQDGPTAVPERCEQDDTYDYYNSSFDVNDLNYQHRDYSDRYYIVIEAEEYSYLREEADYHEWGYTPYKTFWVMQRNGKESTGRDSRGGYLSHHPFANTETTQGGLGVACTWDDLNDGRFCRRNWSKSPYEEVPGGPFPAPRADYEFYAPASTTTNYYVWIRGQGGGWGGESNHIFWGMDGNPVGGEGDFTSGAGYDGASKYRWDWHCLGSKTLDEGNHTLNLWAGGPGFDVDRIVITTNNDNCSWDSYPPDSAGSLPANNGRTRWACDPCDPRFAGLPEGLYVDTDPDPVDEDWWWLPDCSVGANPDQREDSIYNGEMPIRRALDAAKNFITRMDFSLDQIGYVSYQSSLGHSNELECLRRLGPEDCTADVINDTVLYQLNDTEAGGGTNMAKGMKEGIDVLSNKKDEHWPYKQHYGRPGAAHIMVLMTDGEANETPNSYCDDDPDRQWPGGTRAQDCVIYYAYEARDNGIVIYTIGLGYSADQEIMKAVADITGGEYRWAPSPDKLDDIFDELFERIFVRLTD